MGWLIGKQVVRPRKYIRQLLRCANLCSGKDSLLSRPRIKYLA